MFWFRYGLRVIPLIPSTTKIAVTSAQWHTNVSEQAIRNHWSEHPGHEIGCILDGDVLVVETNSDESDYGLRQIEQEHSARPLLIVKTITGYHHYFRVAGEVCVNTHAHDSSTYRHKIGVWGRGEMVSLPPSTDTTVYRFYANAIDGLDEVTQDFIDDIATYNDTSAPYAAPPASPLNTSTSVASEHIRSNLNGAHWEQLRAPLKHNNEQFEPCKYEVIETEVEVPTSGAPADTVHPLARYSLQGHSDLLEKQLINQVPLLGEIALMGQATVIYAAPNTGKTLLTLHMLIQSIDRGHADPAKIFYVNVDDTASGMVEKLRVAEEYGFHVLAEGHRGFKATDLPAIVAGLAESDDARGVVIILDTLKKFTDLMDKAKSSRFATIVRNFVLKGGTVVALAHTNKNPGRNGKPVYSGTSDIVDDMDCAYLLAVVTEQADNREKVVEFANIKRRGDVALSAGYRYSVERNLSYHELLLSVHEVDAARLEPIKHSAEVQSDDQIIDAVETCIAEGIASKMRLAHAAAARTKVSQRTVLKVIEKYTGDDPMQHRWNFVVRDRGAKVFALLDRPNASGEVVQDD